MRRPIAVALIVITVGVGYLGAEDWPRWRGPRGDGTWNGPAIPKQWPKAGLKRLWKRPMGSGYAGIAVVDGRVYTLDRQPLAKTKDAKSPDGMERVLCLAAGTGKTLWTHQYQVRYGGLGGYGNGPRAMPTVHDGRVYTLGAVGHFFCFDAKTGKTLWSKDMVADHQARVPMWGFAASPLIHGDLVIIHTGARPNGSVIAFHRLTGKELWRSLPDPAGYCTPMLIESPSGKQLIVWTPVNIRSVDPGNGKLLWTVPFKITYGVAISSPIYRDNIVFVTGYWQGSRAIRLGKQPTDAEVIWANNEYLRGVMAQPLYRNGIVYSMDRKLGLVCFELKTGKKLWDDHRLTPTGRNPHASTVWLNGSDRTLLLNSDGELVLARFTPKGYQEQSRTRILDGKVWGHPAFADKYVFAKSDGAQNWRRAGPLELVCVSLVQE